MVLGYLLASLGFSDNRSFIFSDDLAAENLRSIKVCRQITSVSHTVRDANAFKYLANVASLLFSKI